MKQRNVRIDQLKALAILFVIVHHLIINDIGLSGVQTNSVQTYYMIPFAIINAFVVVGVNLFFLISGYLGITRRPRKVFRIVFEIYAWWIVLLIIFSFLGLNPLGDIKGSIASILTCFNNYWFLVVYIVLIVLSELLNNVAINTSKIDAISGILGYLLVGCVFAFCLPGGGTSNLGFNKGYSLLSAIALYFIGRLIRIHNIGATVSSKIHLSVYVIFSIVNSGLVILFMTLNKGKYSWYLYSYNNPLIVLASISLLCAFVYCKRNGGYVATGVKGKFIMVVSLNTLGIYILHSSNQFQSYWRAFLINIVVNKSGQDSIISSCLMILTLAINAILVLIVCVALEILFSRTIGKGLDKISLLCERIWQKAYGRILLLADNIL